MFSRKDFIELSRRFVCCRIESYESEEAQERVRSFLGGRFANTAFCILDPTGEKRLTRSGRGPSSVTGRERGPVDGGDERIIAALQSIASEYPQTNDTAAVLQDFHTFRQALNVASADQRLLVYVASPVGDMESVKSVLRPVMADPDIVGRFHLDLGDPVADENWRAKVTGEEGDAGVLVIHADQFGMEGEVVAQLPLESNGELVKSVLLEMNEQFASLEDRKIYSDHVAQGRREGVFFENAVPYGEDRDGDGEIDRAAGRGKGKGKGRPR